MESVSFAIAKKLREKLACTSFAVVSAHTESLPSEFAQAIHLINQRLQQHWLNYGAKNMADKYIYKIANFTARLPLYNHELLQHKQMYAEKEKKGKV